MSDRVDSVPVASCVRDARSEECEAVHVRGVFISAARSAGDAPRKPCSDEATTAESARASASGWAGRVDGMSGCGAVGTKAVQMRHRNCL